MKGLKKNQPTSRRTVKIGDDEFAIDKDGKVFKNGFGQIFTKSKLPYKEKGEKKTVDYKALYKYLYVDELTSSEAVRRVRLKESWRKKSKKERTEQMEAAVSKRRIGIIRSDGRRFESMQAAAKSIKRNKALISKAVKYGRRVRGYTFRKE